MALCALPALALVLFLATPPAHGLLTNDSPGYMYFTAGRPAGYPAFLYIVSHLTGGYGAVRGIQAAMFCGAIVCLGLAAADFAGSQAAALALQAAILVYPPPLQQADQIIADSVSSTLIVLFAAAALRTAMDSRRVLAPALLAAAGGLVRPDNLALFPAAFLLIAFGHGRAGAWRGVMRVGVLAVACIAATPLAQTLVHGAPDHAQPLARGLIQKALFLPANANVACAACDADIIDGEAKSLVTYWRAAPGAFQDILRLRISNLLRYSVIIPALAARHHAAATRDIEPVLVAYTLSRIGHDKLTFAAGAMHEYRNLVINYTFVSPAWRSAYLDYLAANPPPASVTMPMPQADLALWRRAASDLNQRSDDPAQSEFEKNASLAPPAPRNVVAATAIDIVQIAATISAWLFIAALPLLRWARRLARRAIAGAALGIALQLHLIAIAALEIAQPRYVAPLWPLMITILFVASCLAVRSGAGKSSLQQMSRV